jgi:hypothetical protein
LAIAKSSPRKPWLLMRAVPISPLTSGMSFSQDGVYLVYVAAPAPCSTPATSWISAAWSQVWNSLVPRAQLVP